MEFPGTRPDWLGSTEPFPTSAVGERREAAGAALDSRAKAEKQAARMALGSSMDVPVTGDDGASRLARG